MLCGIVANVPNSTELLTSFAAVAAAIYTDEGEKQIEETLDYYRANARVIKEGLERAGFEVYGAVNSPYVWCKAPEGMGSWDLFTLLLEKANVITTPGAGFGPSGEGYIRLSALATLMQPKKEFVASKSCSPGLSLQTMRALPISAWQSPSFCVKVF